MKIVARHMKINICVIMEVLLRRLHEMWSLEAEGNSQRAHCNVINTNFVLKTYASIKVSAFKTYCFNCCLSLMTHSKRWQEAYNVSS